MPRSDLDFSQRAPGPELMDLPCSFEEFRACLQDLAQVNRVTFAYRPTLRWLDSVAMHAVSTSRSLHIVDIGSGGGDMLRRVHRWAERRRLAIKLTGIDLNPYATRVAQEATRPDENITWLTGDAFSFAPLEGIDIVISSLFTHHLTDTEIVRFIRWMETSSNVGWFVNDLYREVIPYHLFRLLAKLAGWHRFVQHDGPLSIRRSFSPGDWHNLCAAAGVRDVSIECYRPARLCVGRIKHAANP